MIEFPVVNIDFKNWPELEESNFLFDEFIYTDDEGVFKIFYKNQLYVDSKGKIYKLIGKQRPRELWRRVLRFLPNAFKVVLLFEPTNKTLSINEFKQLMLKGIDNYGSDEFTKAWKLFIQNSHSINQMMNYEHKL